MRNSIVDNLTLQKYILATGISEDSIQDNLDMIVMEGDFSNARIGWTLDLKEPNLMK